MPLPVLGTSTLDSKHARWPRWALVLAGLCATSLPRGAALPAGAGPSRPSDDKSRAAQELLARARELTDLKAPGSPPFRLRAQLQVLGRDRKQVPGIYLIAWAAPDRFYEQLSFPDFTQARIAAEGKLWRRRNLPYLPLRSWEVMSLLDLPAALRPSPAQKFSKVHAAKLDVTPADCVALAAGEPGEICVDAATGAPLRVTTGADWMNEDPGITGRPAYWVIVQTARYSDYVELGTRLFPRRVRLFEGNVLIVDIHVELLALAESFPEKLFVPPAGDPLAPWCADPAPAALLGHFDFSYGAVYVSSRASPQPALLDVAALHFIVGAEGIPQDVDTEGIANSKLKQNLLKALESARFRPAVCGSIAVEQEMLWPVYIDQRSR